MPGRDPGRSHVPADEGAPTEQLVSGTVGDRCVSCGTPLSSDQRYCVNCGERRGAPRFSLPAATASSDPAPTAAASRPPRRPRVSSGATLVAGVGTLLLAMGVGVLIGHNSSNSTKAASAPATQVIRVNGGSGSSGGTSGGSSNSGGSSSAKHKASSSTHSHHKASASSASTPPPAAAKKASNAASKVLGGSAKNTPPPTVTVGQKGTGPGYSKKTHKFNGSFFGQ